jgi:putative ABC transport system ATP-binding protein
MIRVSGLRTAPFPPAVRDTAFPKLIDTGCAPVLVAGAVVISADKVSKVYSPRRGAGVTAVAGVTLRLALGRSYLLRGASGSGKTTLLSLLGCMVRPTEGRIRVAGREVTRLPEDDLAELRRRVFGFVFQRHQLIERLSALKNVMLPGIPRTDLDGFDRRAGALLARFGLNGRAGTAVRRLSGGERQRVAIARALVNEPLVVIADEPTAHLDSRATFEFLDVIAELQSSGKLVVVASHDPLLCDAGCFDEVFEISDGALREAGR